MKSGRDSMRGRRNRNIESELQSILDNGGNVWAIGDVHGHADTLEALLESLNLDSMDRVVLLGDLVDRGPKSCEVIRIARENPQIFCVLGNHEERNKIFFIKRKNHYEDRLFNLSSKILICFSASSFFFFSSSTTF